jgi:Lrp/AsnC family leucine-responsive transcriptional regulator
VGRQRFIYSPDCIAREMAKKSLMHILDLTDKRILDLLQHDARLTNKEIADKLGKTVTPVYERIRWLEEEGYITRYVALVDGDKIGKHLTAFTTVQLKEHSATALRGFEREVIKFPEVMECYHLTGRFDFLIKMAIKDMKEYNELLMGKLATLPNVGGLETFFVLREGKKETAYRLEMNKDKKDKKR